MERSSYVSVDSNKTTASRLGGIFYVARSPSDTFPYTNCLAVHPSDFPRELVHVLVNGYPLTVRHDKDEQLQEGFVGVSLSQRQWLEIEIGAQVTVEVLPNPPYPDAPSLIQAIEVEVDFLKLGYENSEEYSLHDMATTFVDEFKRIQMTKGQPIVFMYRKEKLRGLIKSMILAEEPPPARKNTGIIFTETSATLSKSPDSTMKTMKTKLGVKRAPSNLLLDSNFKLEYMSIGGLDNRTDMFRRVFASRLHPPELVQRLGIQHTRGLILYGPPGTGKSLIALQIGVMLNARDTKVLNPLKFSQDNPAEIVRNLFLDAEDEYRKLGDKSGLYIVIFDELDVICGHRGLNRNDAGNNGANLLLSKMDELNILTNVLVIGVTNRIDLIDEALMRPGRLEVHIEVPLPDEIGRHQILRIHTTTMQKSGVIDSDVDLRDLASLTKNFSGAEIAKLVRGATGFGISRLGTSNIENLRINRQDFLRALDDIIPSSGQSVAQLQQVVRNGIIRYDGAVDEILKTGDQYANYVRTCTRSTIFGMLLYGPPGSGKSALAASIALNSEYPTIKLLSPDNMIGLSESEKVAMITKVFTDSYQSPLSVVVLDNLEGLIEWVPKSSTFSNLILQTLLALSNRLPPMNRRLFIVATSQTSIFNDLGFTKVFNSELLVPTISSSRSVEIVFRESDLFSSERDRKLVLSTMEKQKIIPKLKIGIKDLLSDIEVARQTTNDTAHRLSVLMKLIRI